MSLIAVTGAKGSPGTTTAAIALAAVWPTRPLLADCDPAGGDIALRVPMLSEPATSGGGLLAYAAELRHGGDHPVWPHVRHAAGGLDVLAGLDASEQAVAVGIGWTAIADGLARLDDGDTDVLADIGRLTADSLAAPVGDRADLVIVVTRAHVGMLVHLRRELRRLSATRPEAVAVLVVADLRETTAVRDVQRAVETSGVPHPIPVVGPLVPDRDPTSLRSGTPSRRSLLVRSARALGPQLQTLATRQRTPEPAHGR